MEQDLRVKVQEQAEEWAAAERKAAERIPVIPDQERAKEGNQVPAAAGARDRDRVTVRAVNNSNQQQV